MEYSAQQIAEVLGGRVEGDPNVKITGFARIESGKPGTICFFANPKYEQYVYTTNCSILICNEDFVPSAAVTPTLVRVENSYTAVAQLLDYVTAQKRKYTRYRGHTCRIRSSARLGRKVYVGDFTYIGRKARIGSESRIFEQVYVGDNVIIGNRCTIYPGVKIYPGTVIGDNVILHAGVVVGSDGFGFAPQEDGTWRKIEHTGNVIIEDDVEIGANTTIDKSQMGSTIIRKGCKLDNLCQIAHNVEVGANTVMAAQNGVAGSARIGEHCIFGGQSGVGGHITIADNTTLAAKTGVVGSVKTPGTTLMGYPAIPHRTFMRAYALFKAAAQAREKKD